MTVVDAPDTPGTSSQPANRSTTTPTQPVSELDDLFKQQAELTATLALRRNQFYILMGISLMFYVVFIGLIVWSGATPFLDSKTLDYRPTYAVLCTLPPALLFTLIALIVNSRTSPFRENLERVKTRVSIIEKLTSPVERSYFDNLVEINVSNLAQYYALVKVHTNNSFIASLSAGVIGFIFIIVGLLVAVTGKENSTTIAAISAAAGVITNFIAAIFFYLYNQTVRELKSYHDSLINVQNILLSFKIMGDMNDGDVKIQTISTMIKFLIGTRVVSEELINSNP